MNFLRDKLKLKENPFRVTPAIKPDETIWAGFPELKDKLEKKIQRSLKLSSSSMILNWGSWGSGKTHAANYFTRKDILQELSNEIGKKPPFSIKVTFPTGKKAVTDLYIMIIDHIDIKKLRTEFQDISDELEEVIENFSQNIIISNIVKAFFNEDVDVSLLKQYLYGTISNKDFDEIKNFDILRKIETDEDRVKVLAGLFSCLTYRQHVYSNIIIWLDEFENISLLNIANIEGVNNFIRELLDNMPNYLLLFLNITQTSLMKAEDLSHYISEAVISRVRSRINFEQPNEKELKLYLRELLNNKLYRRTKKPKNKYHPFDEDAIDMVIEELGEVSVRSYNEAFSILLELAELEETEKIDSEFVSDNSDEIAGWK